jgi:hypothetical protein
MCRNDRYGYNAPDYDNSRESIPCKAVSQVNVSCADEDALVFSRTYNSLDLAEIKESGRTRSGFIDQTKKGMI